MPSSGPLTVSSGETAAAAQTSDSLFGAAPEFDLVLCDEAHRTTGIKYAKKPTRKKTPRRKPPPAAKPARIGCGPSVPMVIIGGGHPTAAWSTPSDNGNSTILSFI